MTKRILSIVLALLMIINVFAITAFAEESDNNASWELTCSNESPKPGDVLAIDVYLQADYVTNTFGALIVYDKNYYEPAESTEGNNIVIASDLVDYGNKTVIMSEKKSASVAAKLYDASYTDEMKAQYAIAWFSFVFQASKFDDPTTDEIPSFANMTKVATLKLKVKTGASSDGNGLIWMDPVYIQTANGSAKYTFVARGTSEIIGQCTTAAKFGQTVDVSNAVLYKAEEAPVCQHANTTVINAAAATCTEPGYTGDTYCNDCQQVIEEGSTIPALGHIEVIDAAVAATCQHTGLTQGSHCSRCNAVLVAQTVVPLADHTVVNDAAVPATCQHTGLTAGSHCSVCNTVIVAQQETPLADHTPGEWEVVTPATCTAKGLKTQSCTVCKTLLAQQDIDMVAHTVVNDEEVPATCIATGLTAGSHCSVCNAVLVAQQVIPLADHTWGNWTVTTPASYTAPGVETRECSVCHTTEDRDIPQLVDNGADYSAVNSALANVPADLSIYTAASVQALNDAIQAVVYGLSETEQERVNGFAADIQAAINNLKLIPTDLANYADLDDYIAKYVPATSNRTNGVYDADELAAIDELIASFDRQLSAADQETVDGYLTSLRVAVAALTIDETKAVAEFAISTDKATAAKDDIITVSLKLKTNYPIYTMQVPVIYDATVFEVVTPNTSVPKSYLTFTGSLANAYKLDGNFNPASSMYKRNSNPSYWSSQTQYKVAYATWAYDVSINNVPVTLDEQEVIATFQLKVISDTADTSGEIFLNSDWIKTATTRGGSLAVGRTQGSVISVLDGTKYEIGQTFDLTDATATVALNPSHEHVAGEWTIEGDKYVLRCTECGEIIESKDLPLATITATENVGTVTLGDTTTITVTADPAVNKVRLVNANGSVVSTTIAQDENTYTISKVFAYQGSEQTYTVQYRLGTTWLASGTVAVNVVKPSDGVATITSKENVGTITLGAVTKITVATSGYIEKFRIVNSDTNSVVSAVNVTNEGSTYTITKEFNIVRDYAENYTVQFKTGDQWKDCGTFSIQVVKPATGPQAVVTAAENVGTIVQGTEAKLTVKVLTGTIQNLRIVNADKVVVSATTVTDIGNNFYTIAKTFTIYRGYEETYTVQYKTGDKWYDCENGEFTVNVVKPAPTMTVKVTEAVNTGTILQGTEAKLTVQVANGTIQNLRIVNADNVVVSAVTVENLGNGIYTVAKTFTIYRGYEETYKVQFKYNNSWYDCTDGTFTVNVIKDVPKMTVKITDAVNTGTILVGTEAKLTVQVTNGTIQNLRIVNADGNVVSAVTVENLGDGIYTVAKTFTIYRGYEETYKVQFKYNNSWYDCTDGTFTVNIVKQPVPQMAVKVIATENVGEIAKGTEAKLTVQVTNGTIQKLRIVNADGNVVSAVTVEDLGDGIYTVAKTFTIFRGYEETYKVQYRYKNVWNDCEDGEFVILVTK